ncbi:MAG: hypothetical protein OJF49_002302 [Ktedonobacterales bacterium]|jgi:polyhydroxyalkanoate synthesis regulator phasin|nr:MAG: hypothetical protein OJF49_002302 [Ktedonobacterales bacterium]
MEHTNDADGHSGLPYHRRARGGLRLLTLLSLGIFALNLLLSACAPDAHQMAQQNKAKLDKEIHNAQVNLFVPDSLLLPIQTQEAALAASTAKGSDQSFQAAASGYSHLYDQLVAIERMTPDQAKAQTSSDIQQLTAALQSVQKQGFVEADQFAQRLQQAKQQFTQLPAAATTKDYFQLDRFVQAQTAAVNQIVPVYQQMQTVESLVKAQNAALGLNTTGPLPLDCARGSNESYFEADPIVNVGSGTPSPTYGYQQWPAQNLALFRAASSAEQYAALTALMNAQVSQLTADATTVLPQQAYTLLQNFQNNVQTYQQSGGTDATYQQQATQDAQTLSAAKTVSDYSALVQTLKQQIKAMALPLIRTQAQHDFKTLQALVNKGVAIKVIDPANGVGYPLAYEYSDPAAGIGDAQQRLQQAQTVDDYQAVEQEIQMFITNLQAMLDNLNDKTPSNQPHQTDLSLMQHYGIASGKVVIVSLSEQQARIYDNGKLVHTNKVTTGAPDLPTPPGIHCVFYMMDHTKFISPYPKGSPHYYEPTPITWAMLYSDYGYYLHDAWWRSWFGKYSNLPHYDPISFNNGSHGCINFPLSDADWVYHWVQIGTPILVY